MLITHHAITPRIDPSAYVAPNAVVCGDVSIGAGSRILFGAQVIAESGSIRIGENCIVMQNAVLRSSAQHALSMGNHCLVGPHAHLVGCAIEDEVFIATGASVFHAAHLGRGSEVRINAVVHIRTHLERGQTVPIGWVAVGQPATLLPPHEHDRIWAIQKPLDFPLTVYGIEREKASMREITTKLSETLGSHMEDQGATPSQ